MPSHPRRKFQPSFKKYDHKFPLADFREFLVEAQMKPTTIGLYLSAVRRLLGNVEDPTNLEQVADYADGLSHAMQVQLVAPWRYYMKFRAAMGQPPVPGLEGTVLGGAWRAQRSLGVRPTRKSAELPELVVQIIKKLGKWIESQRRGKDEIPLWCWYSKDASGCWTVRNGHLGDISTLPVPISALLDVLAEHWTGHQKIGSYVLPASPEKPDKQFDLDRLYKVFKKSLEKKDTEAEKLLEAQQERAATLAGLGAMKAKMKQEAMEALAKQKAEDDDEVGVPVLKFSLD